MAAAAVQFSRVSKRFRLGDEHDSLRSLIAAVRGLLRTGHAPGEDFWALRDVDFEIQPGESVGIIGPNGAGKSTVLKILAGILRPSDGAVRVRGRLAALIEVGAGFHADLTGRENIHLNGVIMGMSRGEVARKLDSIVEFAGLERFLDTPVKRYSSGMYARLGFSIAAHVEPEVLLVDEVLSVGDAAFRIRCLERMRELVDAGTTLVLVTHDLEQMQAICRRTIVFEGGRIRFAGEPGEAVGQYLRAMSHSSLSHGVDVAHHDEGQARAEVHGFRILDSASRETTCVRSRTGAVVEFSVNTRTPVPSAVVELNLRRSTGEMIASINSGRGGERLALAAGINTVRLHLADVPLSGGQYFWNVRLWDAAAAICFLDSPFLFPMVINDAGKATGLVSVDHEWSVAAALPTAPREEAFRSRETAEACA
jgi:ABC-type polysaccharide/polyol phosphate transport system ATPase subunit